MKLHGKKITGTNVEYVVLPRQNGDLVFCAKAVLDYSQFDELCPAPTAPHIRRPGQAKSEPNQNDETFLKGIDEWAGLKAHWMIITSLSATEGLEWETIKMDDPTTWSLYPQELKDSGLTDGEVGRLVQAVTSACGLNQEKIDDATSAFLATLPAVDDE